MTITINSAGSLLLIFGIIFVVIILSMLLKKGDLRKKLLSLGMLIVIFAFTFFMFSRPSQLTIDDEGVESTSYGKISFDWNEVEKALIIEDYQDTGFKPLVKLNGTAVKNFRAGSFKLSNGENVKLITQSAEDAAVFYTDKNIYLIAVDELKAFIDVASEYIDFK
ncbi:MAG: hypothetical protein JEZ04_16560 [Spirochaetales bacterium]|nr:hypothetical protein [Spirochaetales bacterium]